MSGYEENEISLKAFGGTELAKRALTALIDPILLDNFQIISSRVRELDETKIRIFWANDLAGDPEVRNFSDENYRNKFHNMVFISNWQYQQYQLVLGVPYSSKCNVIESGIEPILMNGILEKYSERVTADKIKPIRLCYTSTPQRGLAILLPVFKKLQEKYGEEIHLDVFSSFKIYGWDDYDKQFEPLYEECRSNPGITYKGFQDHSAVIEYLGHEGHIHAYPCTWPETSCRAMLEAMSGKLLCVHPNFAALPDTSGALNIMYQGDTDNQTHANIFVGALDQAISIIKNNDAYLEQKLNFNKAYIDNRFHINKIKAQWEMLFKALLERYPTVESRKFTQDLFVYKQ